MKPILIDINKFGGENAYNDLQELVDKVYKAGFNDGVTTQYPQISNGYFDLPSITFTKDGMLTQEE